MDVSVVGGLSWCFPVCFSRRRPSNSVSPPIWTPCPFSHLSQGLHKTTTCRCRGDMYARTIFTPNPFVERSVDHVPVINQMRLLVINRHTSLLKRFFAGHPSDLPGFSMLGDPCRCQQRSVGHCEPHVSPACFLRRWLKGPQTGT